MQGVSAHAHGSNSKLISNCLLYLVKNWKFNFKFPYMEFHDRIYQFF